MEQLDLFASEAGVPIPPSRFGGKSARYEALKSWPYGNSQVYDRKTALNVGHQLRKQGNKTASRVEGDNVRVWKLQK